MADATNVKYEIEFRNRALGVQSNFQNLAYSLTKLMVDLQLYDDNSNPTYTAAFESIFDSGERTLWLALLVELVDINESWTDNYLDLIQLEL